MYKASAASNEDTTATVASAKAVFPSWCKTNPTQRREISFQAAEELEIGKEECFKLMRKETQVGAKRMFFGLKFEIMMRDTRDTAGLVSSTNGSMQIVRRKAAVPW